jgi:holo-[acyl-carrier protein] synthase
VKSVGVDIVETERIARSVARFGDRFLHRVYTRQELAYCQGRVSSLAARWAAKEAVAKALGTGIGTIRWLDIEIYSNERRQPTVQLHGPAADRAAQLGISSFSISLSHTKAYAVAFVIAA